MGTRLSSGLPDLPDRDAYLARWAALHGGHDPAAPWERGFLTLVYVLARPVARAGVPPAAVTGASVVLAAAAAAAAARGGSWTWGAGLLVVGSAVLDGVDGAVAVLSGRCTRWGYVLDSLADRVSEALFLTAVWLAGAPAWLCVVACGVGWLHEYVRARAAAAGMPGIGVVTVGERPTRVLLAAGSLLAAGVLPGEWPPTTGVAALAVMGAVGLGHLLVVVRRSLHTDPEPRSPQEDP